MYKTRVIILAIVFGGLVVAGLIGLSVYNYLEADTKSTAESQPMKLYLPKDTDEGDEYAKDSSRIRLDVLLYENEGIYVYRDKVLSSGQRIDYRRFRSYLKNVAATDTSILVLIKPGRTATYRNTVNMLDEMTISNIQRYAMVEPSNIEAKIIDSLLNR